MTVNEDFWQQWRDNGQLIIDAPEFKVALGLASAYLIPFAIKDGTRVIFGEFSLDQACKLVAELTPLISDCISLTNKAESEYQTALAIHKASGGNNNG